MVEMTNWSVNLLNCNSTVKLAWLNAKNNSIHYYGAKTSIIRRAKTSIIPFDNKIVCVQSSLESSRGKKKKKTETGRNREQVGGKERSAKLKRIQMEQGLQWCSLWRRFRVSICTCWIPLRFTREVPWTLAFQPAALVASKTAHSWQNQQVPRRELPPSTEGRKYPVTKFFVDGGQAESFPSIRAKISSTIRASLTMLLRLHETEQITGHPAAWRYIGTVIVAIIKMCLCQ